LDGYARVSDVLRAAGLLPDFSKIPPSILERKRQIGTATHRAIELLLQGRLDRDSLDPAVLPYFLAAEAWLVERKPFVVACEEAVADKSRRIKGTLDLRVRLDGEHLIVDFKTTAPKSAREPIHQSAFIQAEGYAELQGEVEVLGLVVLLQKDGSYLERRATADHTHQWKNAASLYVFRRDNGLLQPA
jgi:ATP-dependent exoDNAse (exonuclease V) beta subunit